MTVRSLTWQRFLCKSPVVVAALPCSVVRSEHIPAAPTRTQAVAPFLARDHFATVVNSPTMDRFSLYSLVRLLHLNTFFENYSIFLMKKINIIE